MSEPYWYLMCMKKRNLRIPRKRQILKARGIRPRYTEAWKKEMKMLWKMAQEI